VLWSMVNVCRSMIGTHPHLMVSPHKKANDDCAFRAFATHSLAFHNDS
jgi:hypothetical protein